MLCKTIHKVAMATALWVMALLGASLVNAQIKFDGTAAGTVTYSLEGLASNAELAIDDNAGFYGVSATSSLLNAEKVLEQLTVYRLAQAADNGVWIRVEGEGSLKLFPQTNDANPGPPLAVTGGCWVAIPTERSLSMPDEGIFVYKIDKDEAPISSTSACTTAPTFPTAYGSMDAPKISITLGRNKDGSDLATNPVTGDTATIGVKAGVGMLKVSAYDNGPDALRGGSNGRLFTDSVVATRTASSLDVTITPGTQAISDVEAGFTKFTGNADSATLGSVNVAAKSTAARHLMPDGSLAAFSLSSLIGGDSKVRISSDQGFGFATFRLGATALKPIVTSGGMLATGASCSDPNPDMGTNAMEGVCEVDLATGSQTLMATVIEPGEDETAKVIPSADFMATVMFDDEDTTMKANLPADVGPSAVGKIRQNGSTYQLPMVTTFEGYNNRIIIVNRGTREASYSMEFTTEDGVTATAASGATGMVGAGKAAVVRTMDAVTLEGGMRTAATLFVVGSPSNIDVLTQIVNKSDGSTDTLRYDADQSR